MPLFKVFGMQSAPVSGFYEAETSEDAVAQFYLEFDRFDGLIADVDDVMEVTDVDDDRSTP